MCLMLVCHCNDGSKGRETEKRSTMWPMFIHMFFWACKDDYTSCSAESEMLNHLLATHLRYAGEGVSDEQPVTC